MTPRLVAVTGPLRGWTIYLDDPFISIGRAMSNQIILLDLHVSRHHCIIREKNCRYVIEDLESANGTYLNYRKLKESSLEEGSFIDIGSSRFIFWLRPFDEPQARP